MAPRYSSIFRFLCSPIMRLYVLHSVLWCQLRFPHKNDYRFVFTSSFVGVLMPYLRHMWLIAHSGVQHIVLCFCFVFLRFVYPMLLVSLGCPFLITPSVFSIIYLLPPLACWINETKINVLDTTLCDKVCQCLAMIVTGYSCFQ